MMRVFEEVDWPTISKGDPEAWLYFYEIFLQAYDKDLRKKTGSYYTPPQVVAAMVRLTDEALRSRFGEAMGLASHNVKVADPAVGTGTFLLSVLRTIADTVTARDGEGAVPGEIEAALQRLIGFELQFGPFAVAQLRMLADVAELTNTPSGKVKDAALRLHVADTLADPDEDTAWIPKGLTEIGASRKAANKMKRSEPITVVIGNPPYKVEAKELGGWVADRGKGLPAPIDDWMPPRDWNLGAHAKHLHNLYVYFWRWAAWKVFGGDPFRSGTDKTPSQHSNERGVICFITAAGFLNGPGFQQMRAALRRDADEIWVIDCSPEGHQPAVSSRIFQGVQQPVCIVMAARHGTKAVGASARVLFRELPEGHRGEKFKALAELTLDGPAWLLASTDPRASFLPAGREQWVSFPALPSLFNADSSGCKANRT
jgi:predicted helicase